MIDPGSVIARRDDGVSVIRIADASAAEPWHAAFAGAYQAIWSEPPYNERYTPDEAASVLRRALQVPDHITLLAVRESGVCAGFGIAFPVVSKPDVVRDIRGLLPIEHTFYFAELGVVDRWRNTGLGRELVELRLQLIDHHRYTHVLLRTSATRNAAYDMYKGLGFEDTGVYMEVSSRRTDGSTRSDRRLFMAKVVG
jgi:GNAT superfamily N-acetyltransferase